MAEGESRIPAWRRLGLALKKETQSGVTAPEPSASHSDLQQIAPFDGQNGNPEKFQSHIEPAINGKSSNLGKRKHQHDTAEEDGYTSKRGRASATDYEHNGTTAFEISVIAEVDNATVQAEPSAQPTSDASQPKGDPNYRKKKTKSKKAKRKDHEGTEVESVPAQTDANHDGSTLSPDAAPKKERRALLASTETDHEDLAPSKTPHRFLETRKACIKDTSGSPSAVDRRKSVAFTPDTKSVDGSSAQDYFKKWTAEQTGADADYFAADVAEFYRNALNEGELKDSKRSEEKQKERERKTESRASDGSRAKDRSPTTTSHQGKPAPASTTPVASRGKKKDPSYYVSYLQQYHTGRDHWKFNKAKQNDVIDNALNIFRIPDAHSEALLEYVAGLKGAGVIERLKGKCAATIKQLHKEEETAKESELMEDPAARQAMHNEALQQRIAKEQKRRKVEGDVEALVGHPHSDNFIRRLRRKRAEALLTALGRTAPILPAIQTNGFNPLMTNVAPVRDSKKRKRRVDVSSDESSSDSSSCGEDSSSSESESGSGSEDSSKASGSDSDSDSDSDSFSASASIKAKSSTSEADSESDRDSDSDSGSGSESGSDRSKSSDSNSDHD